MIKAVDHINIVVSDIQKSVKFYTEILGFEIIRSAHLEGEWIDKIVGLKSVRAEVVYIRAPEGEPRLELLCYKNPKGLRLKNNSIPNTIGLRHIAFQVDNIDGIVKRLKKLGVFLFAEPVKVPVGTIEHDAGEKTLLYFTDPDGVILECAEYR